MKWEKTRKLWPWEVRNIFKINYFRTLLSLEALFRLPSSDWEETICLTDVTLCNDGLERRLLKDIFVSSLLVMLWVYILQSQSEEPYLPSQQYLLSKLTATEENSVTDESWWYFSTQKSLWQEAWNLQLMHIRDILCFA